jgi:hypothetical protein
VKVRKKNKKIQLGKNLKLLELWLYSIGIVILLHFCDPMKRKSSPIQNSSNGNNRGYKNAETRFSANV